MQSVVENMQAVVENVSNLSKKIKVTVPQEQVKLEFEKRLKDLAKTAKLKGFRTGKVPTSALKFLKMQYGAAIKQEVIADILVATLQQAIEKENLYPAGQPHIELKNTKEDAPLEYEASFEIYPEVKIDIENITIEKPVVSVNDEHVTQVIEKLQKQNVTWKEVERPASNEDLVVIDFKGFIDDKSFEGGSAEDFKLELGRRMMIPGFEDPIYGKKPGDELEINVTFPSDYHEKKYADQEAKFVVKLKKVMAPEYPELNNAFATDLGVADGTIEGLVKEVRQNLEREVERRIHEQVKKEIIKKMLEKNKIEVPQASVEKEIARLQQQMQKQLSISGVKNPPPLSRDHFEEQARKNVILGLLLSQWIEDKNIKVDEARVKDRIDQIASGYHHPHEIVNWYYGNKEALSEVEAMVLEEQAIEKILEVINVTEKEVSFDELMNTGTQRGEQNA